MRIGSSEFDHVGGGERGDDDVLATGVTIGPHPADHPQRGQTVSGFGRQGVVADDEAVGSGQGELSRMGLRVCQGVAGEQTIAAQEVVLIGESLTGGVHQLQPERSGQQHAAGGILKARIAREVVIKGAQHPGRAVVLGVFRAVGEDDLGTLQHILRRLELMQPKRAEFDAGGLGAKRRVGASVGRLHHPLGPIGGQDHPQLGAWAQAR
jgi:hypothetical protein